jgi:hypothetical protein
MEGKVCARSRMSALVYLDAGCKQVTLDCTLVVVGLNRAFESSITGQRALARNQVIALARVAQDHQFL